MRQKRHETPDEADALHDRLLDAAERCFARWGPSKTSLEDIADEAKVSRSTVYRHVGSRADLIMAINIRQQDRSHDIDRRGDMPVGDWLAEILLMGRDWVQSFAEPGLAHAFANSPRFVEHSRASYAYLLKRLEGRGELRDGLDLNDVVEWILFLRTAVWADDTSDRDGLGRLLRRFVMPLLVGDGRVAEPEQSAG